MDSRTSRRLVVALIGAFAFVVPAALAAPSSGCMHVNPKQWGTGLCQDPAHPVGRMHRCPSFTDYNASVADRMELHSTGQYIDYVSVRSTLPCAETKRVILSTWDRDGPGWDPVHGVYWWTGFGSAGQWRHGHALLLRGFHLADTNLKPPATGTAGVLLESNRIWFDEANLYDCRVASDKYGCVNVGPSAYRHAKL